MLRKLYLFGGSCLLFLLHLTGSLPDELIPTVGFFFKKLFFLCIAVLAVHESHKETSPFLPWHPPLLLCSTSSSSLSNLLIFNVHGWKSFVFWLDLDAMRWYVMLCWLKILLLQTSQAPSLNIRSIRVRKELAPTTIFFPSASYLSFTQDEFLLYRISVSCLK